MKKFDNILQGIKVENIQFIITILEEDDET